ncbi:MAG: hypothetical protein FWE11_07250 [Defluviitaleaceae bacterium]|nr:hypothetical protein [Defluviitaleaceae bacterium]
MIRIVSTNGTNYTTVLREVQLLGYKPKMLKSVKDVPKTTHIILSGNDEPTFMLKGLKSQNLLPKLEKVVKHRNVLILVMGRCMQLLYEGIDGPKGWIPGTGWLSGHVVPFAYGCEPAKGAHAVEFVKDVCGASDGMYRFDMPFQVKDGYEGDLWGEARLSVPDPFPAAVHHRNIYGVQFNLLRSGVQGRELLRGFLNRVPDSGD